MSMTAKGLIFIIAAYVIVWTVMTIYDNL